MTENKIPDDAQDELNRATQLTTDSIRKIIEQQGDKDNPAVSMLSVAERNELIEEIAQIIPAGNVVNFVASGLQNSQKSEVPSATARSHINALFKGVSYMRNNMLYHMIFTGPATVLAGYNMLLQLTGNDPNEYLPDGAWQFYVEFGLREDAARHQCESIAFQKLQRQFRPRLSDTVALTAWVLAATTLLRDYHQLLELRWDEHVRLRVIEETTGLSGLHRAWREVQPFAAPDTKTNLFDARQEAFNQFCDYYLARISKAQWKTFAKRWYDPQYQEERGRQKRAYVRQMSIHRHLEPGEYSDERFPLQADTLKIAIIYQGNYYLLPAQVPATLQTVRQLMATIQAILSQDHPPLCQAALNLAAAPRSAQLKLRATLPKDQRQNLENLRQAPIIINWDERGANAPLPQIRMTQRGIGDHALTIFRTAQSTVFDFSHVFFDGPWALAVAEMLTNDAMKLLHLIKDLPPHPQARAPQPLVIGQNKNFRRILAKQSAPLPGISAEVRRDITPLQNLRRAIKTRTGIRLTVNDILVLYRTIFSTYYRPSQKLKRHIRGLSKHPRGAVLARNLDNMFATGQKQNPSLLIPIDATQHDPKERIFPSTFRSPLPDFRQEHDKLVELCNAATRRGVKKRKGAIMGFQKNREEYLGYLQAFSELMQRYREIATHGESMGTTAIRLIAGLPKAMQQIMDNIPGHFTIVNEAIKGEEVFSNVGRVNAGSSLTRFASAKDDNDKKVLVWGIMTNDADELIITLRDFRQPVLDIANEGHTDVARLITEDYVRAYIDGLYVFASQMETIVTTSVKRR